MYEITWLYPTGEIAYVVICNTQEQMLQEVKDALYDGYYAMVRTLKETKCCK